LDLITARERMFTDAATVGKRAVRAVGVDEQISLLDATDFGVMSRDFGVVQLKRRVGVSAEREWGDVHLNAGALIIASNDEERRHFGGSETRTRLGQW
jgi:hypothetical protein